MFCRHTALLLAQIPRPRPPKTGRIWSRLGASALGFVIDILGEYEIAPGVTIILGDIPTLSNAAELLDAAPDPKTGLELPS